MEDIFELLNDYLDDLDFPVYTPHYSIWDIFTGMPFYCMHCNQNNWIFTGTVFECIHPELTISMGIPITVLDSIPMNKVLRVEEIYIEQS